MPDNISVRFLGKDRVLVLGHRYECELAPGLTLTACPTITPGSFTAALEKPGSSVALERVWSRVSIEHAVSELERALEPYRLLFGGSP